MAEFMYADRIPAEILAWGNELAQIRRDIHQHPELGFDTSRTCGVIATKLSEWGVEFDDKLVEGGVIAVVNGMHPARRWRFAQIWMRLPCPTNLKMPGEVRLHSVVMPAAMTDM